MHRRTRPLTVLAILVGALALTGCSEISTLDHVGEDSFSSKADAEENWGGIASVPDWIPDDASSIRRTYRTDSDAQSVVLASKADPPADSACTEEKRTSKPEVGAADAPKLPDRITRCGPWSIAVSKDGWFAWQNATKPD